MGPAPRLSLPACAARTPRDLLKTLAGVPPATSRVKPGPAPDVLEGDAGDDVLCDTTNQHLLKGGTGNDKLWYDEDAASNQPDPLTTGGLDNSVLPRDSCGKSLYADCETLLLAKPAECTP